MLVYNLKTIAELLLSSCSLPIAQLANCGGSRFELMLIARRIRYTLQISCYFDENLRICGIDVHIFRVEYGRFEFFPLYIIEVLHAGHVPFEPPTSAHQSGRSRKITDMGSIVLYV